MPSSQCLRLLVPVDAPFETFEFLDHLVEGGRLVGIKDSNYPMASRIIRDAMDSTLIKAYSKGSGSKKDASYAPFWS